MKTESKVNLCVLAAAIILAIIPILVFQNAKKNRDKINEMTYKSWVKLTRREDITLQDWLLLKRARLLQIYEANSSMEE